MASDVADTLDKARALIEKGWTQDAEARNADGLDVADLDPSCDDVEPVCWCAGGAMFTVKGDLSYTTVAAVFNAATGAECVAEWNDAEGRTQAEVIQAFKEAAALARAGAL